MQHPTLPEQGALPMHSSGHWRNITEDLLNSVKVLEVGELLHDVSFSAFEAMSAIELMDPKMDAGMLIRQKVPMSFETAVEQGKLELNNLSEEQLIGMIDVSVASFITWLEGHSLAQTLFTNLYFLKPTEICSTTTRTFCFCLLKLVDVCRSIILKAALFEEEDFQQATYHFYYANDISSAKICSMLKESEDDLQKQIRHLKGSDSQVEFCQKRAAVEAVFCRIRFVRLLYTCLQWFSQDEVPKSPEGVSNFFVNSKPQNTAELERLLTQCLGLIDKITATITLGPHHHSDDGNFDWLDYVEPCVNQRLLPATFPRQIQILSRQRAWEAAKALVNQFLDICKLAEHSGDFSTALDFFREFSSQPNCVLSRSALLIYYFPRHLGTNMVYSGTTLTDSIKEAIKNFVTPAVFSSKFNLLQVDLYKKALNEFFSTCTFTLLSLLHTYGNNRARQRDKLAAVLEDLSHVQDEAEKMDSVLNGILQRIEPQRNHIAVFTSFILYHIISVMIEYAVLYKWLIHVLQTAYKILTDMETYLAKQEKSKGDRKKNRLKRKTKQHRLEIARAELEQKMCEGYYKAFMAFHALKKIEVPEFIRDTQYAGLAYEQRFVAFRNIATPPLVSYGQFLKASGMRDCTEYCAEKVFADASICFESAKSMIESQPEMQSAEVTNLLRICKVNLIVLKVLASGRQIEPDRPLMLDFSNHRCYPTFKV